MESCCPICGGGRREALVYEVLTRYECRLLKCEGCGYLGAADPTWLEEAYSDAIVDMDTGVLARARRLEPVLLALAGRSCRPGCRFVDVGAGYGVLVRAMRDRGLDFRWSDPMCRNLLARGFEHSGAADGFTAVELFEHLTDPRSFLVDLLHGTGADLGVICTDLLPVPVPEPTWWYLLPQTGQHISFYERRTIDRLAREAGMQVWSRHNIHILHRGQVGWLDAVLALSRLNRIAAAAFSRRFKSLTDADSGI